MIHRWLETTSVVVANTILPNAMMMMEIAILLIQYIPIVLLFIQRRGLAMDPVLGANSPVLSAVGAWGVVIHSMQNISFVLLRIHGPWRIGDVEIGFLSQKTALLQIDDSFRIQ